MIDSLNEHTKREFLDFAVRTAEKAGNLTLEYFRGSLDIERKEDKTPVTIADKKSGKMIRNAIESVYPDHSILGEEYEEKETDSPFRWIIDPIDGTQSFVRGVPLYAVLIALQYKDEPLLGVIHIPPLNETVAAAIGLGCFHDGERCQVSNTDSLSEAWVHVTDVVSLAKHRPSFLNHLVRKVGFLRTWGDAYGYLLLATGRADVMVDPIMAIWDIAPLMPIITEAGGWFGDIDGNPNPYGKSSLACVSNLRKEIMNLV